jgi:anti-sigma regulatory factor (Ser/Thr protein kinase)
MMDTMCVQVADTSGVGQARRAASDLAQSLGFDAAGVGRVALVVTEAASNLVKHAGGGELLLHPLRGEHPLGIDVLALDRGPGIDDVARATRDGFSTGGTPGTGLGAIRRNSSIADLYTRPGAGTALFARLAAQLPQPRRGMEVGAVNVCFPGEHVSGDAFAIAEEGERLQVLVVDGLGHGQGAADAAHAACALFRAESMLAPAELLARMHRALAGTRGAAVAIAEIDRGREVVRFAGIGNVAGSIVQDGVSRSTVSLYGTLGHDARRFQEFTYPWSRDALVVLHSDGISARWSFDDAPGLASRRATLIAGVLYRDFGRGRDDATVVVLRGPP